MANKISDEAKLGYLVGLYAGMQINRSDLSAADKRTMKSHAGHAAQAVFGGGAFNPLVVWEALSYFDKITLQPQGTETSK